MYINSYNNNMSKFLIKKFTALYLFVTCSSILHSSKHLTRKNPYNWIIKP